MQENIYIQILIEDASGKILVGKVMEKYLENKKGILYDIKSFKGMGRIPKNITGSAIKTKSLLTDLPQYLRGFSNALKHYPGKTAIFVILDCDNKDCMGLKRVLVELYNNLQISTEVHFCIAIEEIEAWLLGDEEALFQAFPEGKKSVFQKYKQDSIIGTWECLADIVYKGGSLKLKKEMTSYFEIGKFKCGCAEKIGEFLNIHNNRSKSFNYFIKKLDLVCEELHI